MDQQIQNYKNSVALTVPQSTQPEIAHARRVFGKSVDMRKVVTQKDLNNAFKIFMNNDEVKKRGEKKKEEPKKDMSELMKQVLNNMA